jgi:hypothetical protein
MENRFPRFSLAQLLTFVAAVAILIAFFPLVIFLLAFAGGALALLAAVLVAATVVTWLVIARFRSASTAPASGSRHDEAGRKRARRRAGVDPFFCRHYIRSLPLRWL